MRTVERARILNRKPIDYLFHHILDGFRSSHQGAGLIKNDGIISEQEYNELLQKNAERLIQRIEEFKITHKLVSIFFAMMFTWMQVSGDDLDMRRSTRTRTSSSRSARSQRSGKRKEL